MWMIGLPDERNFRSTESIATGSTAPAMAISKSLPPNSRLLPLRKNDGQLRSNCQHAATERENSASSETRMMVTRSTQGSGQFLADADIGLMTLSHLGPRLRGRQFQIPAG